MDGREGDELVLDSGASGCGNAFCVFGFVKHEVTESYNNTCVPVPQPIPPDTVGEGAAPPLFPYPSN